MEPSPPPRSRHGPGLRAQIMVALGIGYALSVILLGLATVQLGGRAVDADRASAAGVLAQSLLRDAQIADDPGAEAVLRRLVDGDLVVGAHLVRGDGVELSVGARNGPSVTREQSGARLTLTLEPAERGPSGSLPGLLFLYVGITAAAILLLSYVLLTRLIVRPVEQITRASERVASGGTEARVPVAGAAEVARLAVSFNHMQSQLADERQRLVERLAELEAATDELESAERSLVRSEKLASVGRLAAGIAHEIGNPLTSILGLVELVEAGDLPEGAQREFLGRVRKETERINRIIRDLLDFARAEPVPVVEGASCDLREVVEDAVSLIGPQKDLQRITIERRFDPEAPAIRGGASHLTQVVLNLLLNAADAIEGEGSIVLEVARVDGDVSLVVTDSGPGIPESVQDHLFEPFVTTKPTGAGTGLGLAVCHTLVEGLGGTLEAENAEHGGARFTMRLPAARAPG